MLFRELRAQHQGRSISGAREVDKFVNCTIGIDRDTGRAGLKQAKVSHAPLGRILTDQHNALAGFDALTGEEAGSAER